ncbi:MAG TPA: adenosylmethionine--8-amino-7-oxononanoate transaminase [Polyangiaceae bacterium]|nr:adenosylmethionine--8-amino-7-oxononanoate transaminase [Polyangiaceae bacterium]
MSLDRASIIALDRKHVWHPYTPMDRHLSEGPPLVIARAQGSRLYDHDGRSYIDGNSSWWVAQLGHNHPRLVAALERQARDFCHVALAGITHAPIAELAAELVQVAPSGLERVFFSDDGSTAIDLAVKMCLQFWHQNGRPTRQRFVSLSQAFHGETLAATALGGVEVFRRPFKGSLLDCVHLPIDDETWSTAAATLDDLLEREADQIAGVVIEPMVQGVGGMRIGSAQALRTIRAACDRHAVFLIADEVFTGYGRTGPMWACDHAQVTPDIMCVAKGFTAGILPMAATLCTARIFDGFRGSDERALFYGHTYAGHALGAAVAREVLAIYRDEEVLAEALRKAQRLQAGFVELGRLESVARVRSLGMVAALDLRGDAGYLQQRGRQICAEARARGVYIRPLGNTVYVAPALNIPDLDLEALLSVLHDSVRAVELASSR